MTSTPFSKLKWWPYENLRITRVNNWSDSTSSNPHHSLLTHYSLSQLINPSGILTGVTPALSLRSWTFCTTSSLNKQDCSSLHLADINCISPHSLLKFLLSIPLYLRFEEWHCFIALSCSIVRTLLFWQFSLSLPCLPCVHLYILLVLLIYPLDTPQLSFAQTSAYLILHVIALILIPPPTTRVCNQQRGQRSHRISTTRKILSAILKPQVSQAVVHTLLISH